MSHHASRQAPHSPGLDEINQELLERVQVYVTARARQVPPSEESTAAWDRFFPLCDRLIGGRVGHWRLCEADQCDCIQEVWGEVLGKLQHWETLPILGRFEAWLSGLARHKALDAIRSRYRRPMTQMSAEVLCTLCDDRSPDPGLLYEQELIRKRVQGVLQELARRVSASSYRVFYAHWFEGRTMAEIAEALGMTPAQARFRHHRVTQKLRRLLERSMND
jgi:RNA polymerase sigma factor (sigma-70 family)